MNKNKIFTIISLAFCIILIASASFSKSSAQINAPTVSGGGSYSYSENYTVSCYYGPALFYNTLGHAYANWYCDNGTSGGWQCANQPIPGNGSTGTRTVSGTYAYSCTYLSAVTSWSACSNGTQVALDGTYTTITGQSCTNVATSRTCPVAPTLTATAGSCGGKANLSWTAVTGASGYKIYKNNSLLFSTTSLSYNSFLASTSDSFVAKATVGGGDSASSTAVNAVPSSPCLPLSVTCTATPSPAMVSQNVTWRAIPTGGVSSNYTYSWVGTDGLSGNTVTVNKSYSTIGQKYATTTVVSGVETVTVGCPGNITNGGSGVTITPLVPASGICGEANGGTFANGSALGSANRCYYTLSTSTPSSFSANPPATPGYWSWTCSGINGSNIPSTTCTAYQSETVNSAYDCNTPTANYVSPVNVNNNIMWTVTPKIAGDYTTKWAFTDSNNHNPQFVTGTNSWNKIFTTIGLKTVYVKFASSTAPNIVGNTCATTINIVQTGGSTKEI